MMHGRAVHSNRIFSGPAAHLLSMLCVVMKVLSHASPKKKTKKVKGFKFRTFMGAWFSDNIMAVMGLGSTFSAQPWKGPTRYSCCLLWLKKKL